MHRIRTFLPALLLALSVLAVHGTPLVAQDAMSRDAVAQLQRADAATLADVWGIGLEIADLADSGSEDALAKALGGASAGLGDLGRLAAAAALREIADGPVFGKEILDMLRPVIASQNAENRAAALALLADDELFARRTVADVRELLQKNLTDDLAPPMARIEAARGLWKLGNESEQLAAKKTLEQFLRTRDTELRTRAALALADINTDPSNPGWQVLREVAGQPTAMGRLAASYLQREEERRLFERRMQQLILQQLNGKGGGGDDSEFALLREIMLSAKGQHVRGESFERDEMLENAAKGLMRSLDRHSSFFSSDEFERFFFDLNREYGGIGAFVNFDRDGDFSIVRPIYSGPAYAAGLKSGDKILQVDGWETTGQESEVIISKLKGEPGTAVVLQIARPGFTEPQEVAVTRAQIRVPSVNADMLPGGIGFIELVNFAQSTAEELREALKELKANGLRAVVLDVRNNTGGYLLAARDVVELFVEPGQLVVYTQGRNPSDRFDYHTRPGRQFDTKIPLVVLTNEFSASAAEITAGALQDHGRALVIGDRSFGKGSVQQLLPLRSEPPEEFEDGNNDGVRNEWESFTDRNGNGKYDVGPHMKLTVAQYHLPSGRSIHKEVDNDGKVLNPDWGVSPDIAVELRETSLKDAWKNAEVFELLKANKIQEYAERLVQENSELALQLAEGDAKERARYPGFDEFFAGLDTRLDADDVRRWVRYFIRDEVADLRGKAFPGGRAIGDYQEDQQLQAAIRELLEKTAQPIDSIEAYRGVVPAEPAPAAPETARK